MNIIYLMRDYFACKFKLFSTDVPALGIHFYCTPTTCLHYTVVPMYLCHIFVQINVCVRSLKVRVVVSQLLHEIVEL